MKYQKILSLSLALAASMMVVGAFAQSFTIKGNIPGIKNGTCVKLRCRESNKEIEAKCLTNGSSFVLTGQVKGTMLVQLQIDDKPQNAYKQDEFAEDRGKDFMLEAGQYTVSAACFDSIPYNYAIDQVTMVREKNLRIVGGKAQQQYQEWADATYDTRLRAKTLDKQLRDAQFRDRRKGGADTAAVNRLQPLLDEAELAADAVEAQFVSAHPDYAISLLLQDKRIEKPFAFTSAEYDKMLADFAANYDKARYTEFVKTVGEMRHYLRGSHYQDLTLEAVDGKPVQLKDVVAPGKYNFIDFWASWCGPCRAAIPSVKKMHEKMGDKLNIVSISVDKQRKAWETAMAEEKMAWSQYLVPMAAFKALKDNYFVRYVPSLFVIDPQGNILYYTNDPAQAHAFLEQSLR